MKALAEELKTDEGTMSYADRMAQELAELFEAEEDRAAKEIERRQVRNRGLVLWRMVVDSTRTCPWDELTHLTHPMASGQALMYCLG